ncbi:MAG: response regulator [Sedimentisphaerales bacterium]|nr:response regulator [Sedimentisphaerales bacterium]
MHSQPKVLVVDDQENWRQVLPGILSSDFEIKLASNLMDAEASLRERDFHVLILDIRLVDLDPGNEQGLNLLESIRERDDFDTEVIVLTGYPSYKTAKRSLGELKVSDYFEKKTLSENLDRFRSVIWECAERAYSKKRILSGCYKVLVVEDDPEWRGILVDLLERDGYTVKCVNTGRTALDLLKSEQFGLAIVDLKLSASGGDSVEGVEFLEHPELLESQVEVIVVTGIAYAEPIWKAIRSNRVFKIFMKQNFDIVEFREAVEEVYAKSNTRYLVAWIRNASGRSMKTARQYNLMIQVQSGRSLRHHSVPFLILPSGTTERLKVHVFAEDMEIQPNRIQFVEFNSHTPVFTLPFVVTPTEIGDKQIKIDMYSSNSWLVDLNLGIYLVAE